MKRRISAFSVFSVALIAALLIFARYAESHIRLSEDSDAVKREVLRIVPKGSDIKQAKTKMEKNGFSCTWSKNEEFATFSSDSSQITHPKADFLYCDREQGWIEHQRWQIAILHKNERVVDVFVSYGTISI